ncbi:MAG: B12-binding domain-containing radical SAM protein [Deltaproteobacteria bacterium]|nr:B12-binding domain-containing radical SAM protein [Deltaproteobacteria bacterium]
MPSILMIKPGWAEEIGFMHPATPPLGILSLAAFVEKQRPGKYAFKVVDEKLGRLNHREWSDLLKEIKPDLVGISALSVEATRSVELIRIIKSFKPDLPVIMGGPYPTGARERALEWTGADAVVAGEGEIPFLEILDYLLHNNSLDGLHVPGVLVRSRKIRDAAGYADMVMNLDELPRPAFDLLEIEHYFKMYRATTLDSGTRYLPVITSRGCPYACIYCHNSPGIAYRTMSAARVVQDLDWLARRYNLNEFEIMDDAFNLNRKRVLDICEGIRARGICTRFSFPNGLRGDILDQTVISALKSVGTYFIGFAIESASPRIQEMIRKRIDFARIEENINFAVSSGIFTIGFFMLGFPTETRKEMLKTVEYALRSRLHLAFFFNVVPFEGTELFDLVHGPEAVAPGSERMLYDLQYAVHSLSEHVSSFELSAIQSAANILFYAQPSRIYRIFMDYPTSRLELLKSAMGFGFYMFWNRPRALLKQFVPRLK